MTDITREELTTNMVGRFSSKVNKYGKQIPYVRGQCWERNLVYLLKLSVM